MRMLYNSTVKTLLLFLGDGISSYVQNPPAAGESLKKCLDVAKAAVPEGQRKTTPVYLGATAGMRLLG